MHSSAANKEKKPFEDEAMKLCVKSNLTLTNFQEINRPQSEAAKDRDAGKCTVSTADVAPELKSHSRTYPKFASAPLLLCVTHIDSC